MEEHRRIENERIARIRLQNLQYQNDLEQQISYQRQQKDKQIEEARRELNLTHVSLAFILLLLLLLFSENLNLHTDCLHRILSKEFMFVLIQNISKEIL